MDPAQKTCKRDPLLGRIFHDIRQEKLMISKLRSFVLNTNNKNNLVLHFGAVTSYLDVTGTQVFSILLF